MPSPPDPRRYGPSLADFYLHGSGEIRLPPLPVRPPLDGPVRAVKLAGLTLDHGKVRFWGVGLGNPALHYAAEADAVCHAKLYGHQYSYQVGLYEKFGGTRCVGPHTPPGDHCTCGFYSDDRASPVLTGHDWWAIEVELLGDGIRHGHGWRFARQRVIAVRGPSQCVMCGWQGSSSPPDVAYQAIAGEEVPPSIRSWLSCAGRYPATDRRPIIRAGHARCVDDFNRDHGTQLQAMPFAELRHRLAPVELQTVQPGGRMAALSGAPSAAPHLPGRRAPRRLDPGPARAASRTRGHRGVSRCGSRRLG